MVPPQLCANRKNAWDNIQSFGRTFSCRKSLYRRNEETCIQAVFDAVHACHQQGIAHRDLGPFFNVMIEMIYQNQSCSPEMLSANQVDFSQVTWRAYLIDFGQASAHLADHFKTPTQLNHAHNTIQHEGAQSQVC